MNSRNRVIRHWICGYIIFKPHVWHVRWSKEGRSTGITLIPFFFRGSLIPNIFSGQWKRFSTLLSVPVPYVIWLFTWIGLSHNSTLLSWATGFELRDKIPEIEVNFHQLIYIKPEKGFIPFDISFRIDKGPWIFKHRVTYNTQPVVFLPLPGSRWFHKCLGI